MPGEPQEIVILLVYDESYNLSDSLHITDEPSISGLKIPDAAKT
jgi:hypothetical protein